jgi:hypothetical protein
MAEIIDYQNPLPPSGLRALFARTPRFWVLLSAASIFAMIACGLALRGAFEMMVVSVGFYSGAVFMIAAIISAVRPMRQRNGWRLATSVVTMVLCVILLFFELFVACIGFLKGTRM